MGKKTVKDHGIIKNIKIPVYNIVINLLIHQDCLQAVEMSNTLYKDPDVMEWDFSEMHGCYFYYEKEGMHIIALSEDVSFGTIAHECFHATMSVLKCIGIEYSEGSEEAFAYVLGYMTDIVYKHFRTFKES